MTKKLAFFVLFLTVFINFTANADMPAEAYLPPEPPYQNPHPPITEQDKQRVAFAEQAIKLVLMNPTLLKTMQQRKNMPFSSISFANKDLNCLNNTDCLLGDLNFVMEVGSSPRGVIVETRHPHIIPWSMEKFLQNQKVTYTDTVKKVKQEERKLSPMKPMENMGPALKVDEYMVHVYVKFANASGWYHLDVILAEDKAGKIYLRHFYAIPMPSNNGGLPPGVVC